MNDRIPRSNRCEACGEPLDSAPTVGQMHRGCLTRLLDNAPGRRLVVR